MSQQASIWDNLDQVFVLLQHWIAGYFPAVVAAFCRGNDSRA